MNCAKMLLLVFLAAMDLSIFNGEAQGASVNQNFGSGFNARPQPQYQPPQPQYQSPQPQYQPQQPQYQSPQPQYQPPQPQYQPPQSQYQPPQSQYQTSQSLIDRSIIFETELLKHVAKHNHGNFMISPASVQAALAILLEGARGSCADELKRHLRLPNDQNQIRQHFKAFLGSLNVHSDGVTLESSNKMFLSDKYIADERYADILKNMYYSEILPVNFSHPLTSTYINSVINKSTHGLIPEVLGKGDAATDTILILTNVLYFKGLWENAFNPKMTHPKCFNVANSCRNVAMMEIHGEYKYGFIDELQSQAIEIPFKGGKYSMVILLPKDVNGVTTLLTELSYTPLPKALEQMEDYEVELSLPKFSIDYSHDLISMLQEIGIQEVFNSNADLSGISSTRIKSPQVNSVFHKTHIDVNEQGSVAAAVTGAMVVPLMGSSTARMNIDHPFLFFIRDVKTGTILFQGRVNTPNEVQPAKLKPQPLANPQYNAVSFPSSQQSNVGRQTHDQPNLSAKPTPYQQSVIPQGTYRERETARPTNSRVQPVVSVNANTGQQRYDNRQQSVQQEQETLYDNYQNDYEYQIQSNKGVRGGSQTAVPNYPQNLPNGKKETSGSNILTLPLSLNTYPGANFNPSTASPTKTILFLTSSKFPESQPSINVVSSYYDSLSSKIDRNQVRDNNMNNNVFPLQRNPHGNNEYVKTVQTPPNRMDKEYQATLTRDRDAITFQLS